METNSFTEEFFGGPPFPQSAQLCHDLEFVSKELILRNKQFRQPRLPGQPQIGLSDTTKLLAHCANEVCTPAFDALVDGMFAVRRYNERQNSLSEYSVINRSIVATENPKLHCVWDHDRIFIKPIPIYLTSHAFWRFIGVLGVDRMLQNDLVVAANGFLRSYSRLITHPSDFAIARRHHLIPESWNFDDLVLFLQHFSELPDSVVNPRYRLSEIQLQTLNTSSFVRRGKMYHRIHRNRYNLYFNRFYGPTLFIFATFSVALSAMQVAMAVRQAEAAIEEHQGLPQAGFGGGLGEQWKHMGYAFRWFSLYSICFAASMGGILLTMFAALAFMDLWEMSKDRVGDPKKVK